MMIDKSRSLSQMNRVVFSAVLFALVLGNIIMAIALIPIILIVQGSWIYFIAIAAGLAYGMLFNFMIRDLRHLEQKHHFLAALLVLGSAALSFFLVFKITSFVAPLFKISQPEQHGLTIGLIYIASFLAPYIVDELKSFRE